jgi:ABC-type antimicrobial peptide transport system permease subunit
MFGMTRTWYRVVGIAAEARTVSLGEPVALTAYLGGSSDVGDVMVVRTTRSPTAVIAELPKWMRLVDSQIAVRSELFEDRIALLVQPAKLAAGATASLGAIAMLLASIGIASVIGFGVSQRRREVGIRLALGATAPSVVRLMMRQGAWAASAGLGAGVVLAAGVSVAIRAALFGLNPLDPAAYVVTAALLLGTALVAMYIPSRRAARTDVALTLRED